MTTRSANRTRRLISTSVPWMTGFFLVASALCGAHAEQHNPAKAATFGYVANVEGSTVSVIATNDNTVVATIPVGAIPFGVATTPDGTRAYVTNQNSGNVSVIDTASNKVVATIPVGHLPDGVAITSDRTHPFEHDDRRHQPLAYVTNDHDNTVSVIDTASNNVVATIPAGQSPTAVAITPDGTHAYVTNLTDGTVSVIDTASNNVVATIPVGPTPDGVAITPDGTLAYVTTFLDSTSVIDTASNTVVATIPAGSLPEGMAFATVTPSHRSSEQ